MYRSTGRSIGLLGLSVITANINDIVQSNI